MSNEPGTYKKLTKQDTADLKAGVKKYRKAANLKPGEPWPSGMFLHSTDCGLCARYSTGRDNECSDRCPVVAFTGEQNCINTPYYSEPGPECEGALLNLHNLWKIKAADFPGEIKSYQARCLEEAEFLQSLIDNNPGQ